MKDTSQTKPLLLEAVLSSLFHLALLACVVMTPFATANEQVATEPVFAVTVGGLKRDFSDDIKREKLTQAKLNNVNLASGKTRTQMIEQKPILLKSKVLNQASVRSGYYHSFTIFDAYSYLEEDIDYDGFYRTFSVVFDADVMSASAQEVVEVYADLYLSRNGGPWVHYFSTDNFLIYGESSDDEYEVVTTLLDGYVTDHYDVLIDLYEVGYPDVVATLSGYDVNGLYALPLESVNYDYYEEHYDSHSHGHGGSMSLVMVLALLWLGLVKVVRAKG
ncbi:choice-of-anchor H family protein [Thalassotalea sp. LPB0316]|uniref:choice-of-anchor H family protein n=1 Tax=Thalassotalea sp. LPB0316 TaxID=2769490 RepID=UPI001D04D539|nr:choice-of-anchor H family protein [Thalassotalea sp. LPB0316]